MPFIDYKNFKKLKDYIICIYNNTNGDLCIHVKKEYFKGKKFKNIKYIETFDIDTIEKAVIKKLNNNNGEIIIETYLNKEEADYERQAKRK